MPVFPEIPSRREFSRIYRAPAAGDDPARAQAEQGQKTPEASETGSSTPNGIGSRTKAAEPTPEQIEPDRTEAQPAQLDPPRPVCIRGHDDSSRDTSSSTPAPAAAPETGTRDPERPPCIRDGAEAQPEQIERKFLVFEYSRRRSPAPAAPGAPPYYYIYYIYAIIPRTRPAFIPFLVFQSSRIERTPEGPKPRTSYYIIIIYIAYKEHPKQRSKQSSSRTKKNHARTPP